MTTDVQAFPAGMAAGESPEIRQRLHRGGGWLTLLLVIVMMVSVAGAVNAAAWSEGLIAVQAAAIAGVLLGFLLALSRWEGSFPTLYSFLASIVCTVTLLHRIFLADLSLHDAVQEVIQRNLAWGSALISGAPAADNLIFVMQLSLLAWWLGYLAIWSLVRHQNLLQGVLPAGMGLLVNAYYSPSNLAVYVAVYLAAVVLLAIRTELARNEMRWQVMRVRYSSDIVLDFLGAGVVFAALVIALAWTLPNLSTPGAMEELMRPFDRSWKQVENTWSRMYQSLNYRARVTQVTAFAKSISLGGQVNLTDRPIFRGETPEKTYWRASTFDTYSGGGWLNTDDDTISFDRNQKLSEPEYPRTREMTVTIRVLEARQDVIFAPPNPVRISLPVEADATRLPGELRQVTISMLRSRVAVVQNNTYRVVSAVSSVPAELLRRDHATYPTWISDRFLQVPASLPRRVSRLAREITAPYDNAFDKAAAIESYLRQYTYNLNISPPPTGSDAVDHFLFNSKQGYCDYYASAMIVLLRSVGVPARFATGYTPGQFIDSPQDEARGVESYQVLERNAHSWPEVFFPTFGWIRFEPTASEPLITRPEVQPTPTVAPDAITTPQGEDNSDLLTPEQGRLTGDFGAGGPTGLLKWALEHWLELAIGAALCGLAAGGWLWARRRRAVFLGDPELLARLFGFLGAWANRLRIPWPASHTTLEHATAFSQAVPPAEPTVVRMAGLFVSQQYGRQTHSQPTLAGAADDWRRLQPVLWKGWLKRLIKATGERLRRKTRPR